MDAFELNKYAGWALAALLVVFGGQQVMEIAGSGHGKLAKAGFSLPAPKEAPGATAGAAAPAAKFDFAKVAALMPKASAESGQGTFKKCIACHTADKGGPNRVGPNLYGVIGRKAGSKEGFAYSDGLKAKGDWTYEQLAAFINNPKAFLPSTKMVFAGISEPGEMADLLAYIRTLSDSPPPLPK
jgi:cytochrome c